MKKKCTVCDKEYDGSYTSLLCPDCYDQIQVEKHESAKIPDKGAKTEDVKVTNHPQRYNGGSEYECYKVLKHWLTPEQYKGFLLGNALKYQCRLGKKDDEVQEINKAEWYLDELKNCYGGK